MLKVLIGVGYIYIYIYTYIYVCIYIHTHTHLYNEFIATLSDRLKINIKAEIGKLYEQLNMSPIAKTNLH